MRFRIALLLLLLSLCGGAQAAEPPRLVVQIVVSSMRADDLDRYMPNFGEGGFRRLADEGVRYTQSRYDCQQTTTPVSLATLSTGAMPSTHGVVGTVWNDYVDNSTVRLLEDKTVRCLDYHHGEGGGWSPCNLVAPTLTETLLDYRPESRTATVALDPVSAVVLNGRGGNVFWMDSVGCQWATSSCYAPALPEWVRKRNREKFALNYRMERWTTLLPQERYLNDRYADILSPDDIRKLRKTDKQRADRFQAIPSLIRMRGDYDALRYTPAGNTAVLKFAKAALAQFNMGRDDRTDLLNICLDASRTIMETYGPESVEAEDMYYRLDRDLAEFLRFLFAQVPAERVLVVLTSDHGTSPSCDLGRQEAGRFNVRQFEVIVNGFLSARYGQGDWVLRYAGNSLYLNHNTVYEKGLDLAEIQNEAAIFAMQFRGVSHALSATAMRTSYFGSGYARRMQNGFYPRRSGDVAVNLMPGWIEQREGIRSTSGSMYGYDTRVPLVFAGNGLAPARIARDVEMTSLAPTLARLLGIGEPAAAEGTVLEEIVRP